MPTPVFLWELLTWILSLPDSAGNVESWGQSETDHPLFLFSLLP